MKYKESISKSTRGWKEKFFSRSSSMAEIGSEVRREVNAGIATVSRMMERLETRDNNREGRVNDDVDSSGLGNHSNYRDAINGTPSNGNSNASFAASSI
ncbi:E3 ubiquitin-protein ligase rhf2a [Phtheirospermum japonicum]|uniref:E3 ubiquitin-protein ligase rhf2a n=1 Tax=Phtheirospermum japonicum TaxID=374723 RepID=A0A830CII4_9LAMI|nr:E3 ubiquitin-protein ligase rhf2a [Phtheirospermum japonicum]